jgi:hypothetical protein
VGVIDRAPAFSLHPGEVEDLIEAPLGDLRDPRRLKWGRPAGVHREARWPYFDIGDQMVWGATAMIIGEFVCLFDPDHSPTSVSARR